MGKEGIRTFARSKDKAILLPPLLAAVVQLTALVNSRAEAGMLMVFGFAAQIWAVSKELHRNLSQGSLPHRGRLKKCQNGSSAT